MKTVLLVISIIILLAFGFLVTMSFVDTYEPYSIENYISLDLNQETIIEHMTEYININTTNPPGLQVQPGAPHPYVIFLNNTYIQPLKRLADQRGNPLSIEAKAYKGNIVLIRIYNDEGKIADPKPVLLSSHADVAPVSPYNIDEWKTNPSYAEVSDGYLYGRGILNCKIKGILDLEAVKQIILRKKSIQRDILVLIVPDEETGGEQGTQWMIENHYSELNPDIVIDDGGMGIVRAIGDFVLYNVGLAEKKSVWVSLTIEGESGYAGFTVYHNPNILLGKAINLIDQYSMESKFLPEVEESINRLASKTSFFESMVYKNSFIYPELSSYLLHAYPHASILTENTIAITGMNSGVEMDYIPKYATATLDCRLFPETDVDLFINQLKVYLTEELDIESDRVLFDIIKVREGSASTSFNTRTFKIIEGILMHQDRNALVLPSILPRSTDASYFAAIPGVEVYRITPVVIQPEDLNSIYGSNERIALDQIIIGVEKTFNILYQLCSVR